MRARDSSGKIAGKEARAVLVFIYFEYQRKWRHVRAQNVLREL